MTAANLVARLTHLHQCTPDHWRAVCPAHESKHKMQSLAVRELADGTVSLKCFAGCGAADVVAAVGLELRDLFPPAYSAQIEPRRSQPRHWHAIREAVPTVAHEAMVVAIAPNDGARQPCRADGGDVIRGNARVTAIRPRRRIVKQLEAVGLKVRLRTIGGHVMPVISINQHWPKVP